MEKVVIHTPNMVNIKKMQEDAEEDTYYNFVYRDMLKIIEKKFKALKQQKRKWTKEFKVFQQRTTDYVADQLFWEVVFENLDALSDNINFIFSDLQSSIQYLHNINKEDEKE